MKTAMRRARAAIVVGAAMLATGCATTGPVSKVDPFEPWNRAMYAVNDVVDGQFVRPAVQAYVDYMPVPIQMVIHNVFGNIEDLFSAINGLLTNKLDKAGNDLRRGPRKRAQALRIRSDPTERHATRFAAARKHAARRLSADHQHTVGIGQHIGQGVGDLHTAGSLTGCDQGLERVEQCTSCGNHRPQGVHGSGSRLASISLSPGPPVTTQRLQETTQSMCENVIALLA